MILKKLRDDTSGAVLVEYTYTIPFFLVLLFGIVQAGLLLFTQAGMQHGVEMAARCASVNFAALNVGLNTSCFTDPVTGAPTPAAVDKTTVENYAAKNSWGMKSDLVTATPGVVCGSAKGWSVRAEYKYDLLKYIFSVNLSAESCFPTNVNL